MTYRTLVMKGTARKRNYHNLLKRAGVFDFDSYIQQILLGSGVQSSNYGSVIDTTETILSASRR